MKHVLPFKQRQIEQRQLEAEADKRRASRCAEGSAQARRIEAGGEADARQKLADAEATASSASASRNAEQMAREGALVTQHPLLIQKTLADKLSDKVQVIIAPPPADGGFIGANLIGDAEAYARRNNHARHNRSNGINRWPRPLPRQLRSAPRSSRRIACAARFAARLGEAAGASCGRAKWSRFAASASTICRSTITAASAAASCARIKSVA